MIGYIFISVLYCAVYIAWLRTKSTDDERYYDYGDLKIEYIFLAILGTILWPLVIPFIIFYKIAFKILNKTNKQK